MSNKYYRSSLCEIAHEILWWGYEAARSRINSNCDEEEITGFIYEEMILKLNDPQLPELYNFYEPHEEWHVVGSSKTGKRRQRIDIVVRLTDSRPRAKFCFEAKRLRANGFPIGKYTGSEGIGCFLHEEYAKEDPEAAMIAYIQSDDASRWHAQLQAKYASGKANPMNCVSTPATALQSVSSLIHPNLTDEWKSEHTRDSGKNLTLYHIFLDCK
jgi:hypothetical protein